MTGKMITPRNVVIAAVIALVVLMPVYTNYVGSNFLLSVFTRIVILAIAASSLNLIMGYGGMVSFGHAAFLGIGGYAVGILAFEGLQSGFLQWPVAIVVSAFFALITGALSLRTRGVYFIMITLAFAQMAYYVAVSLNRYGADDGMTLMKRSQFGGLLNISSKVVFYYVCVALLFASLFLIWKLVNSRFGLVIQGTRSNLRRMAAIGFPTFRYQLLCYVIAGTICGLAGALLANHTDFISPATMHWTRSGDLIVMVVLGGMGTLFGPLVGSVVFLALEETLPYVMAKTIDPYFVASGVRPSEFWQIILGPMLLAVALYARGGIDGLLRGPQRD
jgi:branched-chain amino acid transport system permease protein